MFRDKLRPFIFVLGLSLIPVSPVRGQEASPSAPDRTVRTVAGAHYEAGWLHKKFFGSTYRDLWITEITVELLDMSREAGGLTPVRRVGGLQTAGLALRGEDGRAYTFRGMDKDPTAILPEELMDTAIADIAQDQIAASFPGSSVVAAPIARAAGVLHSVPRLVVLPDSELLGEYRDDFAGLLGTLEEFPTPGTFESTEIISGRDMFERLTADPSFRFDAAAFLRARLVDQLLGDWDRHVDQWRWARIPGHDGWQPIAEDRDQAFSRYEGIFMQMTRDREPKFDAYGGDYPPLEGLTWNARSLDRRLLSGLEWSDWQQVTRDLQAALTDEVLRAAVGRLPAEFVEMRGDELVADMTTRRDTLPAQAQRFYRFLAGTVNVYATDSADLVVIDRQGDGSVEIAITTAGDDCAPAAVLSETSFRRRFEPDDTSQVRLYTGGGNDRVVVRGADRAKVNVVVAGGEGENRICDPATGREVAFDMSSADQPGGGNRFSHGVRLVPSEAIQDTGTPESGQGAALAARRDWGSTTFRVPWFGAGPDLGAFLGTGLVLERYGFRKHPYSAQHQFRLGYSTGAKRPRFDYRGDFRFENREAHVTVHALASGIETLNYFGVGNETRDIEDKTFRRVKRTAFAFEARYALPLATNLEVSSGPIVRYSTTTSDDDDVRFVNVDRPYGIEDIAQAGWVAGIGYTSRSRPGVRDLKGSDDITRFGPSPIGPGYTVDVDAEYYPDLLDLEGDYTIARGEATATYFLGRHGPGFGFRVGGEKAWGDVPYYDLAYLGSQQIRGLSSNRFAGDSMVYGNAVFLHRLGSLSLIVPGRWGIMLRGDIGRVYFDGEDSDEWHWGYGGGIWWSPWNFSNAFRLYYANSDDGTALYLLTGLGF